MTSVPIPPSVPDGSPSSQYPPAGSGDPQLDQLAAALAAAQGEFQPIPKNETNPHYKSNYASLDACVHTNKTILAKHGLAVIQAIGFDEHGEILTTILLHKSGQATSSTMQLHPVKGDPQGQGSAVTYARRISFLAITNMTPAGEDTDGEAAGGQQKQQDAPRMSTTLTVDQAREVLLKAVDGDIGRAEQLWALSKFVRVRGTIPISAFNKWLATITTEGPPQRDNPERPFEREGQ